MDAKTILRYSIIGGIYIIPFVALIVTNTLFFPYITGRNFAFRVLVEILAVGWVTLAFVDPRYRPQRSWMLGAIAVFMIIIGLADLTGVNLERSFFSNFERMEGYISLIHLFLFFIITSSVLTTEKLWKGFFMTSIGVSVIVGIAASQSDRLPIIKGGLLGNPIYLAVYMLFHIFLSGLYLLRAWGKDKYLSIVFGIIILLEIYILIETDTRGTALGLLAGAGVIALLLAIFEKNKRIRQTAIGISIAGVLCIAGFATILTINNTTEGEPDNALIQTVNDLPMIGALASIDLSDVNSGTTRLYLWKMALEALPERPLLGWGQENFGYVFNKYYYPILVTQEQWFDRAHNTFVDWLMSGGVLGFLSYVSLYVVLIWLIWHNPKRAWYIRWLPWHTQEETWPIREKIILTGLVTGYIVHNLFVFDNMISYMMFFSIMAYVTARTSTEDDRMFATLPPASPVVGYGVVAPVCIILFALVFHSTIYKPAQASSNLIGAMTFTRHMDPPNYDAGLDAYERALDNAVIGKQEIREQLVDEAQNIGRSDASQKVKDQFYDFTTEQMQLHMQEMPNQTRMYTFWGSMLMNYGELEKAKEVVKHALENSPRKQPILLQLIQIHETLDEREQALEVAEYAYSLNPNYEPVTAIYMALLHSSGDIEKANQVASRASKDAWFDNNILALFQMEDNWQGVIDVRNKRIEILEERLARSPEDSDLEFKLVQEKIWLALTYAEIGQPQTAIAQLEVLKQKYPKYENDINALIEQQLSSSMNQIGNQTIPTNN